MDTEKTIVAIELASSKISGVAGQKQADGSMKVLAYASVPSQTCIRHGAVYNLDRTANAIATVISHLDSMLSTKVERVFVGYNARTLRTLVSHVDRQFPEDTVISQQIIDDMFSESGRDDLDGYITLLLESQEYTIDGRHTPETDPMGVACRRISGSYLKVLLGEQVIEYMGNCFGMASVQILDGFVSAIAEADVILSDDDRQQGCALVDYGADTTTVSVYRGGMLRFLRVIPMGSSLITGDLMQILKIDYDQAESLKRNYGLCSSKPDYDPESRILLADRSFRMSEIAEIVKARNEEIVHNIIDRIKDSGYADVLFSGVVLTGGGSRLEGLQQVFSRLMPKMRAPRLVSGSDNFVWVEPSWNRNDGSQLSLLSVLTKGYENCCDMPLPKMDDIERLTSENQHNVSMGSLFTMDGESAQIERDRQEQERIQARKQAELEAKQADDGASDHNAEGEPELGNGGKKHQNRFMKLFASIIDKGEDFLEQ